MNDSTWIRPSLTPSSENRTSASTVRLANGSRVLSPYRTSSTGTLPRDDPVVQCIIARAAEIQGFLPPKQIENPQITHYEQGQEFQPHFDWAADDLGKAKNRMATVFSILESECGNCGTSFPRIPIDWSSREQDWCEFFACENKTMVTKPVAGSAIYWRNVHPNGTGDLRTLHAGLPLDYGFKTGLNIWTRIPA